METEIVIDPFSEQADYQTIRPSKQELLILAHCRIA